MYNSFEPVLFSWIINAPKYRKPLKIALTILFLPLPILVDIILSVIYDSYSFENGSHYFIRITADSLQQGLFKDGINRGRLRPATHKNRMGYEFSDYYIAVIKLEEIEEIVIAPAGNRIIIRLSNGKKAFINFFESNIHDLMPIFSILEQHT